MAIYKITCTYCLSLGLDFAGGDDDDLASKEAAAAVAVFTWIKTRQTGGRIDRVVWMEKLVVEENPSTWHTMCTLTAMSEMWQNWPLTKFFKIAMCFFVDI